MYDALTLLITLGIIGGVTAWIVYVVVANWRMWRLYGQHRQANPLYIAWNIRCHLRAIGRGPSRFRSCLLVIAHDGITLYPRTWWMREKYTFTPADLRWFGRPKKYTSGDNDIWLHFEQGERWHLLRVRASQYLVQLMVRALKAIGTPEQVVAYRRRRPYIHYGPIGANPVEQDIHGAWTLHDPVHLYLTPAFLVILRQGTVVRALPLASIQQIGALKRLDAPEDGLVRFQMEGEPFAFAVTDYERFAAALAEAAKRTLEAPLMQKGKALDDLDFDYDYVESDQVEMVGDYILTDDGELQRRA